MKKRERPPKQPIVEEEQVTMVEVFGKRVLWCRLGRNKYAFNSNINKNVGSNTFVIDVRSNRGYKLKEFVDNRRNNKYYYDWGEIDRLIYKYWYDKHVYRDKHGKDIRACDLPDEIIETRNKIIELLFNLINTIIYTYSFHQQIHDGDLFQDSVEKLIALLDNDKHDPVRGTSFTFFTVSLKNMIFTQIKKNKRYVRIDQLGRIPDNEDRPAQAIMRMHQHNDYAGDYDTYDESVRTTDVFDLYTPSNAGTSFEFFDEQDLAYLEQLKGTPKEDV